MATQILKEQSTYSAAFRVLRESLNAGQNPSWLERLRENAFTRFETLGFPNIKQEEWKYTNVAPLAKAEFEPAFVIKGEAHPAIDDAQLRNFIYEEAAQSQLVFINGIYRGELSSTEALPGGVSVMDMASALEDEEHAALLRETLARYADFNDDGFVALNTAFIKSGAFLFIPKGVEVKAPVHLLFLSDGRQASVASFPRVLVVAESGSTATLIESYASLGEAASFTNAVVEINLQDGARLHHYRTQRENAASFHIATTRASLARNSSYDSTAVTLGAQLSRHDINVTLDEEGAECWVDGLYIVGGRQHTDTHSLIDHRRPHCTSHQLYKGILDGHARAVFNGKVFVREGAQQTDARQTNRNLLLSNDARVDTKPQLEIFADDVKCAHGATVGQLEEEELFYLASRGLEPDIARNLLTYGFAEEVIEKIRVESIRKQLDEAVLNRLHAQLEP